MDTCRAWGEANEWGPAVGTVLPFMQPNPASGDNTFMADSLRRAVGYVSSNFVSTDRDYSVVLLYVFRDRKGHLAGWVVADVGGRVDNPADLPFGAEVEVAGTDPNDDTVADFIVGTVAGKEEMGAEVSLIEPKAPAAGKPESAARIDDGDGRWGRDTRGDVSRCL